MRYFSALLLLLFFAVGCSTKGRHVRPISPAAHIHSKSYIVTFKTSKFAFSDTGFLTRYPDSIGLQVFTAGKPMLDMKVYTKEDNICVRKVCKYKHGFNRFYLTGAYPDTLIENILSFKPLMRGKNLQKTKDGFTQHIQTNAYDIRYTVSDHDLIFKDSKNHFILKLKELPQ